MAAVPQRTLNWLYSILIRDHYDPKQTYQDPNRTYYDVANALAQYPSLSPRTDVYTYETGFSTLLLLIAGTIPVPFRGTLYKFPVALWIPTTYPREPPMVYVTPTHDMVVRVGQHVTLEGRVYHHYLAHWLEAWDRSTIADLLSILRDVFATEPPVKYKQPMQQPQPQPQSMPTPPPVPPLPPGFGPSMTQSVPSPRPEAQVPPPPPPKPGQMVAAEQQQQTPPAGRYNSPPPLPPLPPEEQARRQSFSPQTSMSPGGTASPYRVPQQPHMAGPAYGTPVNPAQNSTWQQPPRQYPPQQIPRHPAYQQSPVAPYPHSPMPHQRQLSQATPTTQPMPTPTPAPAQTAPKQQAPAPAPDLLTSPFELELPSFAPTGPAPPIPPNPEKDALIKAVSKTLAETVQSNVSQSESAAHSLTSQSHSLHNAIATLQAEISSLNSLNTTLQSNTSILQHSLQRADTVIADAQTRLSSSQSPTSASASPLPTSSTDTTTSTSVSVQGLPPIDEILVAPTVVGKQLYDLVTEEAGIQQAIYALQVALVKDVIGVETWSRHTRGLAREAFLKRALGRKVAVGLGCEGV